MPIDPAWRTQIHAELRTRYFPVIPQLPGNRSEEEKDKNRLSHSLAAFAISKLAGVDTATAVNAVVDGGNDNGIDALHYDRTAKKLFLVQSKLGNAPDSGENLKFCKGIRDLLGARFHRFNPSFARLRSDVEEALDTDGVQAIGCHVHLGEGLERHATDDLNGLAAELNEFSERFAWRDLNLAVVHGWLAEEHAIAPLTVQVTLRRWYGVDQPHRAFYGLVTARQLADLYQAHGKSLFEKNIRYYLGNESVNSAIVDTVRTHPGELFYLNNGLTAVCSSIRPLPGATNAEGAFRAEGFSIVNGAQTVGSVLAAFSADGDVSPDAVVMITLIEVGNAGEALGSQITRARNTQNAIRKLHFAALDVQQERLRRELAIIGKTYRYRPSQEDARAAADSVVLEEAALALASLSGDTAMIVAAKGTVGRIHDANDEFYPRLFNANLSGARLWRAVQIYRFANDILAASERAEAGARRRTFYRHGRFFILHLFAKRQGALLYKSELELSDADKREISRTVLELAEFTFSVAERTFQQTRGYLAIFRNSTDAAPLARQMLRELAEREAEQRAADAAAKAEQQNEPDR
jgi:hypothetical protein